MLLGGEIVQISIPELKDSKAFELRLNVLYEDEHLAIINKPAGISVSGNKFKTIANALAGSLKQSTRKDAVHPQPVHRLDYPTTGLLLIGKTSHSIRALNEMFESKRIEKTYFAIAIGEMNSEGLIASEIEGKKSQTQFNLIESVPSERFKHLNFLKLNPKTGRRHQIRIHLSSLGNPILGDQTYGKDGLILKGKGLYLHAGSLKFIHPFTNQIIHQESDLPAKFLKIFPDAING